MSDTTLESVPDKLPTTPATLPPFAVIVPRTIAFSTFLALLPKSPPTLPLPLTVIEPWKDTLVTSLLASPARISPAMPPTLPPFALIVTFLRCKPLTEPLPILSNIPTFCVAPPKP